MKTSIIFFLSFIMIFNLIACSDNADKSDNDAVNNELNPEVLSRSTMESRYLLFTYKTNSEFHSKFSKAVEDVANANYFEISTNTVNNCRKISSKIKIVNNQALFEEYVYLDANDNILESYIFAPSTGTYVSNNSSQTYNAGNGGCPEGTSFISSCPYDQNLKICIDSHTSSYVIEQLEENSSVTVTVTNTLTNVILCGKSSK